MTLPSNCVGCRSFLGVSLGLEIFIETPNLCAKKYSFLPLDCLLSLYLLCSPYQNTGLLILILCHDIGVRLLTFRMNIQEPEELFETISQALLSSVDRDCLSGWGGHVYVV